jgi:hypothetical protein
MFIATTPSSLLTTSSSCYTFLLLSQVPSLKYQNCLTLTAISLRIQTLPITIYSTINYISVQEFLIADYADYTSSRF